MCKFRMYLGQHDRSGLHIHRDAMDKFFTDEVSQRLEAYTLYPAQGFFKGEMEATIILEYIGDPLERAKIDTLGRIYADRFDQAEVLITSEYVSEEDVTRIHGEPATITQEVA